MSKELRKIIGIMILLWKTKLKKVNIDVGGDDDDSDISDYDDDDFDEDTEVEEIVLAYECDTDIDDLENNEVQKDSIDLEDDMLGSKRIR